MLVLLSAPMLAMNENPEDSTDDAFSSETFDVESDMKLNPEEAGAEAVEACGSGSVDCVVISDTDGGADGVSTAAAIDDDDGAMNENPLDVAAAPSEASLSSFFSVAGAVEAPFISSPPNMISIGSYGSFCLMLQVWCM